MRWWRRVLSAATGVALAAAGAGFAGCGGAGHSAPRPAPGGGAGTAGPGAVTVPAAGLATPGRVPSIASLHGRPVAVDVGAAAAARRLPGDFLGLSFEAGDLPRLSRYADRGNLVALLRSLGPGVMRFGGVSVDTLTAWSPTGARPAWAQGVIRPSDLRGIGRLAALSGWRVLLTVGLGHVDPAAAASEATAARAALGSSLAGLEIGNEPDAYVAKGLRGAGWGFAAYLRQVALYRSALARAAPGVPVVGPDASSGLKPLGWVRASAGALHPPLLTDHFYPSTSCGYAPVPDDLLAASTRAVQAVALSAASRVATDTRTPLRLDETNNVSCGGQPGVSDAFVSAVWAAAYVAEAVDSRVSGLDFHNQLRKAGSYTPLLAPGLAALDSGALRPQPEFYGLLLASGLRVGLPLVTRVTGDGAVVAAAVRAPDGRLRLLLADNDLPGAGAVVVRLRVPAGYRGGTILRLTGRSPGALGGTRLAGRAIPSDGRWRLPDRLPAVAVGGGGLAVQLEPVSAALVTLER